MTTITYKTFSLETESLNSSALAYLIEYGFKQSLQDSVAGVKKAALEEGQTEADAEALVLSTMQVRFDAIIAGEVATRSQGPRLVGVDKFIADYAEVVLKAQCAKKKISWPTGKGSAETIKGWREALLTSPMGDKVKKEGERQFKESLKLAKQEDEGETFDFLS